MSATDPTTPAPRRVVITGLGALTGPCTGVDELWSALTTSDPAPTHRDIIGFEPRRWVDRRQAQRTGRFSQLAVAAAVQARADAGDPVDDPEAVAVILGTGNGGGADLIRAHQDLLENGPTGVPMLLGVITMSNANSANVAFSLGTKGITYSVASGCTSGTHAVEQAFRAIRYGSADAAYCGGSQGSQASGEAGSDLTAASLINLRVHTEESVSRPFDRNRQGFVLSEGAAVLRLETLDAARARGAHVYAEVLGGANTVDGYDLIQPSPRGEGLRRCMVLALRDAGVTPAQVRHVNCHGTGTRHNDQAESDAAVDLFGLPGPALNSVKAITGHSGAGAGAVEAVAVALSIDRKLIPQTQWLQHLDPDITADVVQGEPRPWEPGIALSNSVGLGGQNGTLVLGPSPI